eukprot:Nitzschia sp. Nitz4//scaffold20_size174350//17454//18944//NITZ4_002079-RA/size174350-snap-gene-0.212-mRNA-1//1//CDS//3329541740//7639//frame0
MSTISKDSSPTTCNMTMSRKRKLRVLVITTQGSERQKHIQNLFSHPTMAEHFEPPTFSPSVSSRALRNRFEFFKITNEAGLIPKLEWEAMLEAHESGRYEKCPERFFDCLKEVPKEIEGRRGSKSDLNLHYSCEFWYKAKTINRGRSVLGCSLAHLIALKRFTTEGFDVMLEDNVRAPVESCAQQILDAQQASRNRAVEEGVDCHFRFIGWLGSLTNLEYLFQTHMPKRSFPQGSSQTRVSPYPHLQDVEEDLPPADDSANVAVATEVTSPCTAEGDKDEKSSGTRHARPGGNFVWGSYAYWISETAYQRLLDTLRKDVGAMLWKGKRARFYSVKPIDKMLPRQIMSLCGKESVQLSTKPAFFRAPMLTSKIHIQWDPEFCKSTEYQLESIGLKWSDLWLSEQENKVVANRLANGVWEPIKEENGNEKEEAS